MRAGKVDTYVERIARVIEFIEESLRHGRVPSLSDMAGVAALSEYHFHRVFRLMAGETPADAVSRVRLSAALALLEAGDLPGAVAASGYATSQAFARALKERVGASPSQLRADRELLARSRSSLSSPEVSAVPGGAPVMIEVADVKPIRLVTRRNVGDFSKLNAAYEQLFQELGAHIDPSRIIGIYGIPWDDPRFVPGARCRFDCGVEVGAGPLPETLTRMEIHGGPHAGLQHRGDYDDLHAAIDALYRWAIREGRGIADRPLFIQYLDDPEVVAPPDQRAIAWLPLQEDRC